MDTLGVLELDAFELLFDTLVACVLWVEVLVAGTFRFTKFAKDALLLRIGFFAAGFANVAKPRLVAVFGFSFGLNCFVDKSSISSTSSAATRFIPDAELLLWNLICLQNKND